MADKSQVFFPSDANKIISELGKEKLLENLRRMLLIRNFEVRAESAYQQGKVGGFFHAYIGQEAVQTAAYQALGPNNWYTTSYRCHALALLTGATPNELMAELYGKVNGNAKGRGGSMHFFTERLLGGFGIVGNQVPIAIGAAFTCKYTGKKDELSICFLGDGAVAQGAVHESLNLASLWDLPCIIVIENNHWGMGTSVNKAVAAEKLAEDTAPAYKMKGYTFDGMDFFNCYAGFEHVTKEVLNTSRPVLVEVITERFRGHSISDPGLYRTKENLKECMQRDPIIIMQNALSAAGMLTDQAFKEMDKHEREVVLEAMKYAEDSPWPDLLTLEEGVYA